MGLRPVVQVVDAAAEAVEATVEVASAATRGANVIEQASEVGVIASAGHAVRRFNKVPLGIGASVIGGAAAGVFSGVRGTLRDMNRTAGNPIGFAADMGIRRTFSNGYKTKDDMNATGDLAYRMPRSNRSRFL